MSVSLMIPDSSKKEEKLLNRLQQFTMDSLGALLYLQEQLTEGKEANPERTKAAVKTSIALLEMQQRTSTWNTEKCHEILEQEPSTASNSFSLSTVQKVLTKFLKPAMAYLWSVIYIDNILLMGQAEEIAQDHTVITPGALEFLVNYPNSQLVPTQGIDFLGFRINSITMSLSLPDMNSTHIHQEG